MAARVGSTLALLVLASLVPPSSSLMFHSKAVSKQWDTWAFVENGTCEIVSCCLPSHHKPTVYRRLPCTSALPCPRTHTHTLKLTHT